MIRAGLAVLAWALLLAACGDEETSPTPTPTPTASLGPAAATPTATPTPTPEPAGSPLAKGSVRPSEDDLAAMVLSQDELGEIARGMIFSPDSSGVVSNAKVAATSFQPNDTAADQAAAGRVTGYIAEYSVNRPGFAGDSVH